MHKLLLILIFIVTLLEANSAKKEKFQILAKKVNSKENIVIATGNVVIFSPSYYILAEKAVYDKTSETFELFNDVVILQNNEVLAQSDYAFLDINKEQMFQNPIFVLNSNTNVWITSKDLEQDKNIYLFENSILSSCDCIDPAWSIRFTDGEYDSKEQWIDTYNTRLYIKDIPMFYTPYFGFSTDKTRRTGLLPATVGYSSKEGFTYAQPIFIAPADNYDFELIPEVRMQRGYGTYAYYRYADSPDSMLSIKTGFWEEKSNYKNKQNLKNRKHYGYNLDYERTNLFASKKEDEDGLLIDLNWLNDVEFRNIRPDGEPTEKKVQSKINYFYDAPQYYVGSYFRYYYNTALDSNATTFQQLPELQAHKFSDSLIFDKLLYSADFNYTNMYRESGSNSNKFELQIPLSYSFYMFDDFLNITFKEELTAIQQDYSNTNSNFSNATYFENRHSVSVSTDLIKKYDEVVHSMNLKSELTIPNQFAVDGDIYGINSTDSELSSFPITKSAKSLTFSLNQSIYGNEDLEEIINHKMSQAIVYDDYDNSKLGHMESEIIYYYLYGTARNKLLYSHLDDKLVEHSSSFNFDYLNYYLQLSYYMSKNTPNSGKSENESYAVNLGYEFLRDYKVSYYENYNIQKSLRSKQGIVFTVDDKCWNLNLKYEKEIEATSSKTASTIQQDIIYFELVLKPLGQINQRYRVKDTSRN